MEAGDGLKAGDVYVQGNWAQLKASMGEFGGVAQPRCLFFGDHLIQDVLAADRCRIDAVAIVEELAAEASHHPHLNSNMWGSFFHESQPDQSIHFQHQDPSRIPKHPQHLHLVAGTQGIDAMNTVWSSLIGHNSRLCISDVESLTTLGVAHRSFPGQPSSRSHFIGFFPDLPASLPWSIDRQFWFNWMLMAPTHTHPHTPTHSYLCDDFIGFDPILSHFSLTGSRRWNDTNTTMALMRRLLSSCKFSTQPQHKSKP